jgi:single-strand DNA-binding protein
MNKVMLFGRLAADPTIKSFGDGKVVCNLALAVPRGKGECDFFDCEAWGDVAQHVSQSAKKGTEAMVLGSLITQSWNDKQTGQLRKKVVIRASQVEVFAPQQQSIPAPRTAPSPANYSYI